MSEPQTYTIKILSSGDTEIDTIAICIEALKQIREINTRVRVVDYLMARFGEPVTLEK